MNSILTMPNSNSTSSLRQNASFNYTQPQQPEQNLYFIYLLNKFTTISLYTEMALCFTLNLISLTCILYSKSLTSIKILIINLAIADMLYACGIPFYARQFSDAHLSQSLFGCRLSFLLDVTCMIVIVFTIAALTLERYFCLRETKIIENDKKNLKIIFIYIIFLWTLAILFSLPKTISVIVVNHEGLTSCGSSFDHFFEQVYTISKWIFAFAFPYTLIILFSTLLLKFLKEWSKKAQLLLGSAASLKSHATNVNARDINEGSKLFEEEKTCQDTQNEGNLMKKFNSDSKKSYFMYSLKRLCCDSRKSPIKVQLEMPVNHKTSKTLMIKRRTARFVLAVVFSFLCCWSPLWIFQIFIIFNESDSFWLQVLMNLTNILVYLGGVINPLLYMLLTENFREFLAKFFFKKKF